MLDFRTLVLANSTCSTVLLAVLWAGAHGEQQRGTTAFIRAVTLQTVAGFAIGLRPHLPTVLGHAGSNVLVSLAFTHYAQSLCDFAEQRFERRLHPAIAAFMFVATVALTPFESARIVFVNTLLALGITWLAWSAARLPARPRSSSRTLLALGFALLAAVNVSRVVAALGLFGAPLHIDGTSSLSVATVLGYLIGIMSIAIGFLLLQKERAETEMESLRGSLEDRVHAQVERLTRDEAEVERLHGELRQRVKERSEALTRALSRLAFRSQEGGVEQGTVLGERFELGTLLGKGGMGAVYRALDRATGEQVAVKIISATSADELDAMRRFLREARASASVAHPSVVYARHVDVSHGQLYLVFELVEGASLAEVLATARTLDSATAALLGARMASALAAAHTKGVLHRDIKPANVMLSTKSPAVRLLDFGIARLRDAVLDEVTRTHGGALLGTPAYMAPEQALDARSAREASDVYALGALLFEALSARLPFEGREVGRQIVAKVTGTAPRLIDVAPSVAPELASWVDRCLAREADARPTAQTLATELERLAETLGAVESSLATLGERVLRAHEARRELEARSTVREGATRDHSPAAPREKSDA